MSGIGIPNGRHDDIDDKPVIVRGRVSSRPRGDWDPLADLVAATVKARTEFGVSCFWNAPDLPDPVENARLVIGRLRTYGGRPGWVAAASLDKAVREAAGTSDRP